MVEIEMKVDDVVDLNSDTVQVYIGDSDTNFRAEILILTI